MGGDGYACRSDLLGLNLWTSFARPTSGSVGCPMGVDGCEFGRGNDRFCIA